MNGAPPRLTENHRVGKIVNVLIISESMVAEEKGIPTDWQLLAQISLMFRTVADAYMDDVEMHRAQAMLMCTLFRADGLTQSEIAEELSVQGATITNMLQRMEEAGLVIRRRDEADNRLVRVYLTQDGREKEQVIRERFAALETAIFAGISPDDRTRFRQLMLALLDNMNRLG